MEWTDEGIVLGTRRQGESSAVLEAMTATRGRHLGLVRGARSRAHAAVLQPGNRVRLTWRARLDEHLGQFTVEPIAQRAAALMAIPAALLAVQTLAGHLRLLPERDPHADLFEALETVVAHLATGAAATPADAAEWVVRFEILLLDSLGIGLDLAACALTGATVDLAWVSPRTGRAASRAAGAAFADRLLPLPAFLAPAAGSNHPPPTPADLDDAFRLTGFFLGRHVWEPRGLDPPDTRDRLRALAAGPGLGDR